MCRSRVVPCGWSFFCRAAAAAWAFTTPSFGDGCALAERPLPFGTKARPGHCRCRCRPANASHGISRQSVQRQHCGCCERQRQRQPNQCQLRRLCSASAVRVRDSGRAVAAPPTRSASRQGRRRRNHCAHLRATCRAGCRGDVCRVKPRTLTLGLSRTRTGTRIELPDLPAGAQRHLAAASLRSKSLCAHEHVSIQNRSCRCPSLFSAFLSLTRCVLCRGMSFVAFRREL